MRLAVVLLCVACACSTSPGAGRERPEKPSAPVNLRVETVAARGGWDVILTATPTRDADALLLRLDLPGQDAAQSFGPTRAGETRRLAARAVAPRAGADVVGEARVRIGGSERSRAAIARIGAAAQPITPRPIRRVTLPSGVGVAEVRP